MLLALLSKEEWKLWIVSCKICLSRPSLDLGFLICEVAIITVAQMVAADIRPRVDSGRPAGPALSGEPCVLNI